MKFLLARFWDEPQGITRHRFNISALLSSVWTTLLCNVGRITVEATSSGTCGRGGLIPQRQTGWFRVWRNPGWYKGWGVGLRDGVSIMDVALWHICLRLSFSFVWKRICHLKPRIPQQVKESNKSLVWTPLKGRENLGAVGMREQRR